MAISDWLTVTPDTGNSGQTTITVSASSLSELSNRAKAIRITSGNLTEDVIVKQKTTGASLSISPGMLVLPDSGGTGTLNVVCSGSWTISPMRSWIQFSASAGTGNATITVTADSNSSRSDRGATFFIRSGSMSASTDIWQYKEEYLTLFPTSLNLAPNANTQFVMVTPSLTGQTWSVQSYPDWVTAITPTSSTQEEVVTFSYGANTGTTPRTGSINFLYKGVTYYMGITQNCLDYLTVSPTGLTFPSSRSANTISISSNTDWNVIYPSWIVGPTTGTGNMQIVVTASTNTGAQRTGVITARTSDSSIVSAITCTQSKPTSFAVSPDSLSYPSATTAYTVSITSDGDWTVASKPDWITLSASSGSGNASLTVTALTNFNTMMRTGAVTFTVDGGTHILSVAQAIGNDDGKWFEFNNRYSTLEMVGVPGGTLVSVNSGATEPYTYGMFVGEGSRVRIFHDTMWDNTFQGTMCYDVLIGSAVTSIGEAALRNAFYGENKIIIPDSVTEIGINAFAFNNGWPSDEGSLTAVTFGTGITEIPFYSFYGTDLRNIVIPNTVTKIGSHAFANDGWSGYTSRLTSITLSDNLEVIEEAAFSGHTGLTGTLVIPNSVKYIGDSAFSQSNYSTIYIGENVRGIGSFYTPSSGLSAIHYNTKYINTLNFETFGTNLPQSGTLYYYPGLVIGDLSNYQNWTLVPIENDGWLEITTTAGTINLLTSWVYPGFTFYMSIDGGAKVPYSPNIGNAGVEKTVRYYAAHSIYCEVENDNIAIEHITNITFNNYSVCDSCYSATTLTSVTFGNTVHSINRSFVDCNSLSSINIPGSVISVYNSFRKCNSLSSITISDSPEMGLEYAFMGCTGLTSITIGTINSIKNRSFSGCTNLSTIYLDGSVNEVENDSLTFKNVPATGTLYYHSGTDISPFQNNTNLSGWTFTTY